MEWFQTDTEAGVESSVGTGRAEQLGRILREINANWQLDGHGLRGPQRPQQHETPVRPEPMQFGVGVPSRESGGGGSANPPCAPTPRDPEEEGTFVWGSVDGVCQWIDTTDCST